MSYRMGDMNMPGRGDPETWGPCLGDPMDPRTPEPDAQDCQISDWLESVESDVAEIRQCYDLGMLDRAEYLIGKFEKRGERE